MSNILLLDEKYDVIVTNDKKFVSKEIPSLRNVCINPIKEK